MAGITILLVWVLLPNIGIAAVGWEWLIARGLGSLFVFGRAVHAWFRQRVDKGGALGSVDLLAPPDENTGKMQETKISTG